MDKPIKLLFLTAVLLCTCGGMSGQGMRALPSADFLRPTAEPVSPGDIEQAISFARGMLGRSYRCLQEGRMMDCSGFVSYVWSKQQLELPRSPAGIAAVVDRIAYEDIQKGDLLFFKGRDLSSGRIGHVSMVVDCQGGRIKMIHSCNRGIIVDDYPMSYYRDRYLFAGRLVRPATFGGVASEVVAPHAPESASLESKTSVLEDVEAEEEGLKEIISVIGVGDIMLGTNYPSAAYLPPNDGRDILKPVKSILMDADLTFGNLEGVLLTGSGPVKKCSNPSICYAFKSPDHYAGYLKDAGFDVLSIANNHVGDFGDVGRKNTMKVLESTGIHYAGLLSKPYTVFTHNGVKYGFCAFAPNTGTASINDYESAKATIKHLNSVSDIVIVSFHGGAEGAQYRNINRKREIFLGENRGNPYEFARLAIDAGADIVFGHGPHVTRAIDLYKGRFIAYSLGNFATYGRFSLSGSSGVAPIIKVSVNRQGEFQGAEITSIVQPGKGGPVVDKEHKALKEIKALTRQDIPECPLDIRPDGKILLKQ